MEAKILLGDTSAAALAESIASSGLVPPDKLASAVTVAGDDPQLLAQQLVAEKLLTRFQIVHLSQGKGSTLRIGNYDILDRLGAGGMGTVYKARHRRMKRIVALKVLSATFNANETYVKRFLREVETIASLGHPNIVMAYDADQADAGHFLVMEFVDGRDLALCLEEKGLFSVYGAVDCILQAARGLAYAHAQGIIHRDIKPHNLLLDNQGIVKITDLGLARLSRDVESKALTEVTIAGGIIGTAEYMSPEQAMDSTTLDYRSDIYSLGCTLYCMIAGRPPYSGNTVMAILLNHRDAPIPSLAALHPDVPPALDNLFNRMVAKVPEQRIQRMSDVVSELELIAAQLDEYQVVSKADGATIELTGPYGDSIDLQAARETRTVATQEAGPTVMVVEPSRVQAAIIKGYLQEHAFEAVGTAANGQDALAAVRSLRPRAVISAMHLPDIDGLSLAAQIRAEFRVNAPGFVLITSESDDSSSGELKELNRVMSLLKPFTSEQLREAIHQVTGASTSFSPKSDQRDRGQLRVLIVDDSTAARMHIRRVLNEIGFQHFLEDADGAHAIVTASRERCDLIVTDYNMPLMDGRALVSYLKQNPATSAIPIVMVTSETEPKVLDPVRKLGVVAIIEKAFPAAVIGPLIDSLF